MNFPDLKKRRGRPKKEVDIDVMHHMLKNKASIAAVARHVGIHRDTVYTNYKAIIAEGRASHSEAWAKIANVMLAEFFEKKRLKEEAKRKKRKYRERGVYYPGRR